MKKTLIALAALAATASFAQSTVTLYGYGDMGVGKSVGTGEKTQFNPGTADVGGIRLGMKGSEDLGGGMKANFQLETNGISEAGAGDGGYGRAAWFGLSGSFGAVQLGRQARNSVSAGATGSAAGWRGTDVEAATGQRYSINNNVAASSRNSAMINYITPTVNGFTARLGYVNAADNSNAAITDVALMYSNGPLNLAYGQIKAQGKEANSGVHANYDMGVATVYGSFNKRGLIKGTAASTAYTLASTCTTSTTVACTGTAAPYTVATTTAAVADTAAQDGFSVGAKIPFGATTVYATYGKNNDSKVTAYELGADYALSKRTALTAFTASTKGKDAGFYAGVRHSF